jgi:hypothetical protein
MGHILGFNGLVYEVGPTSGGLNSKNRPVGGPYLT